MMYYLLELIVYVVGYLVIGYLSFHAAAAIKYHLYWNRYYQILNSLSEEEFISLSSSVPEHRHRTYNLSVVLFRKHEPEKFRSKYDILLAIFFPFQYLMEETFTHFGFCGTKYIDHTDKGETDYKSFYERTTDGSKTARILLWLPNLLIFMPLCLIFIFCGFARELIYNLIGIDQKKIEQKVNSTLLVNNSYLLKSKEEIQQTTINDLIMEEVASRESPPN